ncbi:MAG TPA: PQQ-binding-like beta-propeller repeat protein [Candidatus Limnocylindrales bacterium]|nr:PQQ-binding-like beta-propeller repeat protein [Candidatus Limnocylindrales bacterium]
MSQVTAKPDVIFAGGGGSVAALDRGTGQEVWRTNLKGSSFVNVVVDGDRLYATASGEIFALDAATGSVLWHNPLRGMGFGPIAIGAPDGQQGLINCAVEQQRETESAAVTSVIISQA